MAIPNANIMAVAISAFGLTFLYIGKEYINPFVKKRSPVPIPFELLLVIFGIIFSTLLNVNEKYHISIVNTIPQGFPEPHLPDISLLPKLIPDCISIAIICYIFVVSLGKLFAKKHGYKIDPTQELFALGFMEIFSSFLPVYPAGAALSRSSVCEASGVKTQFYTIFTSILLLIVILWLGPLLEPLPMCILSCIVIISLKSLFLQVKQLPRLWKVSKFDFAVWVIVCVSTICTTVTLGLLISFIVVLLTVVLQQQWPKFVTYGTDENFEAFYPFKSYEKLMEIPHGAKLFKFEGPLHFANSVKFVDTLLHLISESDTELVEVKADGEIDKDVSVKQKNIILDCSAMVFIDSMGFEALLEACAIFGLKMIVTPV
uniref:STAS domain-containing protein n=1 Tax=Panagrolaimus davidi TaxID=227884 RepID=A0A914QXG4_9BILA